MKKSIYIVSFFLFGILLACGRKGPVVPPELFSYGPVDNFHGLYKGKRIGLSWKPSHRFANGQKAPPALIYVLYREDYDIKAKDFVNARKLKTMEFLPSAEKVEDLVYYFQDTQIQRGEKYKYSVAAVDEEGEEGVLSSLIIQASEMRILPPLR